jgi:hypothetical protein
MHAFQQQKEPSEASQDNVDPSGAINGNRIPVELAEDAANPTTNSKLGPSNVDNGVPSNVDDTAQTETTQDEMDLHSDIPAAQPEPQLQALPTASNSPSVTGSARRGICHLVHLLDVDVN